MRSDMKKFETPAKKFEQKCGKIIKRVYNIILVHIMGNSGENFKNKP